MKAFPRLFWSLQDSPLPPSPTVITARTRGGSGTKQPEPPAGGSSRRFPRRRAWQAASFTGGSDNAWAPAPGGRRSPCGKRWDGMGRAELQTGQGHVPVGDKAYGIFTGLIQAEKQLFSLVEIVWFPLTSGLLLWFYLSSVVF